MRVTDDRYTRDRLRLDLAQRLIHHEARTFNIRQWTGLSDDRIRKLYRSYVANGGAQLILRHRGKSPRQPAHFFRSAERSFQAAQLASIYIIFGLLNASTLGVEARLELRSLPACLLLCQAYEAYLQIHAPHAPLSFEHAWFLLLALARRQEIGISQCGRCGGIKLCDLLSHRPAHCANCETGSLKLDLGEAAR